MAISSFISHNEYTLLDMTQNLINISAVYEFRPFADSFSIKMCYFLFSPFLHVSFLFVHLELIDGTPTLKINHGSGTVVLQLPGNINVADRRWHRLDVRSNSKVGCFTTSTPMYTYTCVFMMSYTVSQIKPPSSCTAPYVAYVCLKEHLFLCDNTAALKLTFSNHAAFRILASANFCPRF